MSLNPELSDLGVNRPIEWSDSWTDEDLADATAASVRYFEEQERELDVNTHEFGFPGLRLHQRITGVKPSE